ncbi:MAG: type II toxin-antitoxin system Phd/YefM family antitoxin [Rhodoferax sp.]|nr:type II toxin-antitoxin system Phd/YefM family antitoxin [Rhodoferax sp.]
MKFITSREFNRDVSFAKREARIEPVLITDRGQPTHVLMGIEDFRRLTGEGESIVDILAMPDVAELDVNDTSDGTWDHREGLEG